MSFTIFEPSVWPSAVWDLLPRGEWLTLSRCPVPYVLLRPRGDARNIVRAWIGIPLPLDPSRDYEVRTIADPNVDAFTDPGASNAVFTWLRRKTEIVVSSTPIPRGVCEMAFSVKNANAAGYTALPVRWTTEGLTTALVELVSDGVISNAYLREYDPDFGGPTSLYQDGALTTASGFIKGFTGGRQAYDSNGAAYLRVCVPRGVQLGLAFPVTTTPTVMVRAFGELS